MKIKPSTTILRLALIGIVCITLVFCIFIFPAAWKDAPVEFPAIPQALIIAVLALYASIIPFFVGLWQGWKLLGYIDHGNAFSQKSVRALRTIKYLALGMGTLLMGTLVPAFYPLAEADDAPGLIIVGLVIASAPIVVSVFAAVLEKLLASAIDLQSENELTV
jgi:hypothetical protein